MRNNSADIEVGEEVVEGDVPGTRSEIPLQPVEKTLAIQVAPCSTWRFTVEQIHTLQPVEDPMLEQVDVP